MSYVALKPLKWGDETIAPGDMVPEEEGRSYASLLRTGRIAEVNPVEQMSDTELASAYKKLKAENLELAEHLKEATIADVPDDVTPGETPGWPIDEDGVAYTLPDAVRKELADLHAQVTQLREQSTEPAERQIEALAEQSGAEGSKEEPEVAEDDSAADPPDPFEGVKAVGGGYYVLPDGTKVRGRAAVEKALAEQSGDGSKV